MPNYVSLNPDELSTAVLYGHLVAAIAPRPIAFASTIGADGQVNLSPFSYFNVFGANPPVMIFSAARRARNNTTKHTLDNVREVPEVVINIVNYPMVEQMSLTSAEYPREVNEFTKSGLTPIASDKVKPPRVGESPAAFECKVLQIIETGQEGGAGQLIVAQVIQMHLREDYLDDRGRLDIPKLDLVARMGGSYYCRASPEALFEIPKPLASLGIGVDQLADDIRHSPVLTGNHLGRLGNAEKLPTTADIEDMRQSDVVRAILEAHDTRAEQQLALHQYASTLIEQDQTDKALAVLHIHV